MPIYFMHFSCTFHALSMLYLWSIYGFEVMWWCGDVVMWWCDDVVMWWWCGDVVMWKFENEEMRKLIISDFWIKKRTENVGSWFSNISFGHPSNKGKLFSKNSFLQTWAELYLFQRELLLQEEASSRYLNPDHSKGHRLLILYCKNCHIYKQKWLFQRAPKNRVRNRAEHKTAVYFLRKVQHQTIFQTSENPDANQPQHPRLSLPGRKPVSCPKIALHKKV